MVKARPSTDSRHAYRADIDGLRALSILLVVGFHSGLGIVAGGFVGVDVFFVLSGYLITGLLVAEHQRTGRISLLNFFARRIRRLLPLAFLVIVTTTSLGWWLVPPLQRRELVGDARSAALYFANWRFAGKATAYSDAEVTDGLFTHYWSLAIEEQFYLLWPLVVVACGLMAVRLARASMAGVLGCAAVAVTVAAFTLAMIATERASSAYFLTHARIWEMTAGACLAIGLARLRPIGTAGVPLRTVPGATGPLEARTE